MFEEIKNVLKLVYYKEITGHYTVFAYLPDDALENPSLNINIDYNNSSFFSVKCNKFE